MKAAVLSEPELPKGCAAPAFLVCAWTLRFDVLGAEGFFPGAFFAVVLAFTVGLVFAAAFAFATGLAFAGAFLALTFGAVFCFFAEVTAFFWAFGLVAAGAFFATLAFFAAAAFFATGVFFGGAFFAAVVFLAGAFLAGAFAFTLDFAVFADFVLDFGVANGFFSLADFCLGFGRFAFDEARPFFFTPPETAFDAPADFLAGATTFFDDFLTAGEDLRLAIMVAPRCVNRSISENQRRTLTEWSVGAKRKFLALCLSKPLDRGATISARQIGLLWFHEDATFFKEEPIHPGF